MFDADHFGFLFAFFPPCFRFYSCIGLAGVLKVLIEGGIFLRAGLVRKLGDNERFRGAEHS